jgi:hypothetical protein
MRWAGRAASSGRTGQGDTRPMPNRRGEPYVLAAERLGEPEHVACGVAEGAVTDAVGLVDRFLQNLGAGGADLLERGVAVVSGEDDPAQQALGQQGGGRLPVSGRCIRALAGCDQADLDARLRRRAR